MLHINFCLSGVLKCLDKCDVSVLIRCFHSSQIVDKHLIVCFNHGKVMLLPSSGVHGLEFIPPSMNVSYCLLLSTHYVLIGLTTASGWGRLHLHIMASYRLMESHSGFLLTGSNFMQINICQCCAEKKYCSAIHARYDWRHKVDYANVSVTNTDWLLKTTDGGLVAC